MAETAIYQRKLANSLLDIYRRARIESQQNGRRRLSPKHASLAAFAAIQPDSAWNDHRRRWNEAYPQWSYGSDQCANFRRDVRRAQNRLLYPDWFHAQPSLNK